MISKIAKNAIDSIKKNIEAYEKEMEKVKGKIEVIDEKYRKLAEEEKKDLSSTYDSLSSELNIWKTTLSAYGEDAPVTVSVTQETEEVPENDSPVEATPTVEETPEVVVDTVFPENNENAEPETKEKPEAVPVFEEPVTENVESTPVESMDEDGWPEENSAAAVPDDAATEEDGWPAFPEEWK